MKQFNNETQLEEEKPSGLLNKLKHLDFDQLFFKYRYLLFILILGIILIGLGIFASKRGASLSQTKVEVLSQPSGADTGEKEIVVEVSGEVEKPGVYRLPAASRVEDLLILAGGVSAGADRIWMDKMLNRAAKLTDGQKVFIPSAVSQSNTATAKNQTGGSGGNQTSQNAGVVAGAGDSSMVNINTASLSELDTLPGIGPAHGQSIIEHRPYSTLEELVSKGALSKSVYEKVKEKVTVY
jgi:competence protein ComEA